MARLRDITPVIRKVGLFTFVKRVWIQVADDDVLTLGAAMAYSWLFAVVPFVIFLMSLVPLVPERFKPNVDDEIATFLKDAKVPEQVAAVIMRPVRDMLNNPHPGTFLSFGLILAMWAGSGGMNMTMFAMDKAYDVELRRPFYKQRPLAVLLTGVVATLILIVMVLMPVGTGVIQWLIKHAIMSARLAFLVNFARYAMALVLLFTVLAVVYHFGPNFKQRFHPITPGAVFSVAVWLALGQFFRMYLTKFGGAANYNRTYGAVAGAAILLLFFYIDSLVLLIGAEINSEIDMEMGFGPPKA